LRFEESSGSDLGDGAYESKALWRIRSYFLNVFKEVDDKL